jgi:nucleoid DNA-binding protein
MTRKEFIQTMVAKTGATKADMEVTVGALLEVISDTLKKGDSLSFPGFGSFEVRERPVYRGQSEDGRRNANWSFQDSNVHGRCQAQGGSK